MSSDSQSKLDALATRIQTEDPTPELSAYATQLVMGEGSPDADIVFIGEAPGKNEDLEGRPFVGASGKLLNLMLEDAGLSREDVYITNIVKYRPPNNRDPLPKERAAFLPYLLEQLEIIKPKVVITLGRISMEYFIPDALISAVHGQSRQVMLGGRQITIVPLYHPAAGLRNGTTRRVMMADFQNVVAKLAHDMSL